MPAAAAPASFRMIKLMGSHHWKCPRCGEVFRKGPLRPIVERLINDGDDVIGGTACGRCGAAVSHVEVYSGLCDVVLAGVDEDRRELPLIRTEGEIKGKAAAPPQDLTEEAVPDESDWIHEKREPKPSEVTTRKVARNRVSGRPSPISVTVYAALLVLWFFGVPWLAYDRLVLDGTLFSAMPDVSEPMQALIVAALGAVYAVPLVWLYARLRALSRGKALFLLVLLLTALAGLILWYATDHYSF
jgi:hypothetical protein